MDIDIDLDLNNDRQYLMELMFDSDASFERNMYATLYAIMNFKLIYKYHYRGIGLKKLGSWIRISFSWKPSIRTKEIYELEEVKTMLKRLDERSIKYKIIGRTMLVKTKNIENYIIACKLKGDLI